MSLADRRGDVATLQACTAKWNGAEEIPPVHDIITKHGLRQPPPDVGLFLVGVLPERIDRPQAECAGACGMLSVVPGTRVYSVLRQCAEVLPRQGAVSLNT